MICWRICLMSVLLLAERNSDQSRAALSHPFLLRRSVPGERQSIRVSHRIPISLVLLLTDLIDETIAMSHVQ